MAMWMMVPVSIGASILFGFGFDKRANWISNAWGIVALGAVATYMLTTWNTTPD